MMELENRDSVYAVSKILIFAIVSYSFYFNAIEVANYFALMPAFVGSLFSGYDPVSAFSTLAQAASLGNVVRFDSYAAAGNVCHYHDPGADGYTEICEGANGHKVEGCNAGVAETYSCSSGNCQLASETCTGGQVCGVASFGYPSCTLPPSASMILKKGTRNIINDGPQIASGTAITVEVTATDADGIDFIQYADTGGTPTYSGSQSCSGVTPCTKSWTITPAVGSWTFDADVKDTKGAWGDLDPDVGPVNVVNSCASWTGGTPSISTAQYVNYVSCTHPGFVCDPGYEVHVTHSGKTETSNDILTICGNPYSSSSGWTGTVTDCNAQSTGSITFASDYSIHGASATLGGTGQVSISSATCHSTDSQAPTTTDNTDANWHSNNVGVTLTCTDNPNPGGIGCDKMYYCIDTSGPIDCPPACVDVAAPAGCDTPVSSASVTMTQTGWIRYYSTDLNSNTESPIVNSANLVMIDKNDPTSSFTTAPSDGNWANPSGFSITVSDADTGGSNLASCSYRVCSNIDGDTCNDMTSGSMDGTCSGASSSVTKSITVGAAGNCNDEGTAPRCQVQVYATDAGGRSSALTIPTNVRTYKVDYTKPSSLVTAPSGTAAEIFDVLWWVDDATSGPSTVTIDVKVNAGSWSAWSTCTSALACWDAGGAAIGNKHFGKLSYSGTAGNTYAFRAQATDAAGNTENVHGSADVSAKAVGLPGLTSPSDGGDITTVTPNLQWTSATGANSYALQICTNPACLPAQKAQGDVCVTGTSYQVLPSVLSWQTTYYWKLWPSADSCASYRSPTQWSFNTKLLAPQQISPLDTASTSFTPTLTWNSVSGANCYQLNVIRSSDGFTIIAGYNTASTNHIINSGLSQDVEYKWKVKASSDTCGAFGLSSPQWRFTTRGVCSGLPVAAACDEYPLEAVGTNQAVWTTPQVEASTITTSDPSYWKVTLPSMYQAFSPVPGDDGRRPVESYDFGVTATVQSGTITPTVKIGTTAGGSEICTGGSSCGEGVTPDVYYIKIEATSGSGNVYPEIRYKVSFCGLGNPSWNPDTVADSDSVDVGGCSVTIRHLAGDVTDGSTGRFKDLGLTNNLGYWDVLHQTVAARQRTIEFDDLPSGGCDMDLKFMNEWIVNGDGVEPNVIKVFNLKQDKDAGHTLFYGYRLESASCVFVPGATGTCFDDPNVAGNDCANSPTYDADKRGVVWIQNVGTNGAPPPDSERVQNVEFYNVWQCDPADNTNTAGNNAFCNSKNPNIPYCDPNLKKCEPCSIVNNNPSGVSGKPNQNDCGVGGDGVTIGKCDLFPLASIGGTCSFASTCDTNADCSTSCCSAVSQTSGPERIIPQTLGNKCITPGSPNNPMSSLNAPINSYLCKNV